MTGLCLGLAFALVEARIPAADFTLAWTHSVEKVRWEEDYRVTDAGLVPTAARVQGSGAGMEPPPGAVPRDGGWRYRPPLAALDRLTLARSGYTADYSLCWDGRCATLTELLGPPPQAGGTVELFPCDRGSQGR